MLEDHRSRYGLAADRCAYVPLWSPVEPRARAPFRDNELARRLGLADRFVVLYAGNMGLLHDMSTLVRAAQLLQDDDRVRFLFIGRGMRRAAAERLAARLRLHNVVWMDFVPREELEVALGCSHVAAVSLRQSAAGSAVPSKFYGALAVGRGVLAQVPDGSEIARTLAETGAGIVVPPGDAAALAAVIRQLADDPGHTDRLGERAFGAYAERFRLEYAVDALTRRWGWAGDRAAS